MRSVGVPLEDDPAAVVAGAGAEVDIQSASAMTAWWCAMTMTDLPEPTSRSSRPSKPLDVGEVEAGGRLVEDVDITLLGHLGGQLEPLPLAAGQRGGERLAEAEVAEPDVGETVEDLVGGRGACVAVVEELLGLGDRHREHLGDVPLPSMYSSTDARTAFPHTPRRWIRRWP